MLDIQKVQEIIKPLTVQIPVGIKLSKSEFLQPKQAKSSKCMGKGIFLYTKQLNRKDAKSETIMNEQTNGISIT
jgi:hypothetical protein